MKVLFHFLDNFLRVKFIINENAKFLMLLCQNHFFLVCIIFIGKKTLKKLKKSQYLK